METVEAEMAVRLTQGENQELASDLKLGTPLRWTARMATHSSVFHVILANQRTVISNMAAASVKVKVEE